MIQKEFLKTRTNLQEIKKAETIEIETDEEFDDVDD